MSSVYRSVSSKQKILGLYEKYLSRLSIPVESKYIDTRFGKTHLLLGYQDKKPPLIIFHGGNSINPFDLKMLEPMLYDFSFIAPDTIGQPGKSEDFQPSSSNDDYGKWAVDILDALHIPNANFIGTSVGGGILLRLAAFAPERINKAVFIVPMGFGNGPMLKMIKRLAIPSMAYIKTPKKELLEKALEGLVFNKREISEELLEHYGCIFQNTRLIGTIIKTPKVNRLKKLGSPCMLISCRNDIMFPSNKIIPIARRLLPNLKNILLLDDSNHIINEANMKTIQSQIAFFLDQ
jgi:pimeloyl-ACP methyl ester carboxylesterase